jgi:N-methylhydantoinase B
VQPGNVIELITTGGGGWGDPLLRDPDLVRWDVVRGLVSEQAAREVYGVQLGSDIDRTVDAAATERLRSELREQSRSDGMFDRGPNFERLKGGTT